MSAIAYYVFNTMKCFLFNWQYYFSVPPTERLQNVNVMQRIVFVSIQRFPIKEIAILLPWSSLESKHRLRLNDYNDQFPNFQNCQSHL